jgi:hypothetical protein
MVHGKESTMQKRRLVGVLAGLSLLVLGGTGLTSAAAAPPLPAQACQRLTQQLGQLEATAASLDQGIQLLEQVAQSLTGRPRTLALRLLSRLEAQAQRLDDRITRLENTLAERCAPAPDPGGDTGPTGPPAGGE